MDVPKLPFCRKAQAQITGSLQHDSESIIVFGGSGLDYTETANSGYLADLWRLDIVKSSNFDSTPDFSWTQITPSPGRPWPRPRKNFGYAASQREGWLVVHGGEFQTNAYTTDLSQSILTDLWLHRPDKWIQLNPGGSLAPTYPFARANHVMTVLPKSGRLFMFGGMSYWPSDKRASTSGHPAQDLYCMGDSWILNLNAVIDSLDSSIWSQSNDPSLEEAKTKQTSNMTTSWQATATFPMPNPKLKCLKGMTVTGIIDPRDGREKVLMFGGRYSEAEAVGGSWRRLEAASRGGDASAQQNENHQSTRSSSSSSDSSSGSSSSSSSDKGHDAASGIYAYSNMVHLYDPSLDQWEAVDHGSSSSGNDSIPIGRDKHASAYVPELNMVFFSGGRSYKSLDLLSTAKSDPQPSTLPPSTSPATPPAPPASRHKSLPSNFSGLVTHSGASYTIMDMWAYNLTSRSWIQYASGADLTKINRRKYPPNDKQVRSAENKHGRTLGSSVQPVVPSARYEHSMSVYRGADGQDGPSIVLFGGQQELRRSSISSARRDLLNTLPSGTGPWVVVSDDDSSSGTIGIHSQLNDVWSFTLQGAKPAVTGHGEQVGQWQLISMGGCNSGETGKLSTHPGLDLNALMFICAVVGAFLIGLAAHQAFAALHQWMRGQQYERISEESARGTSASKSGDASIEIAALVRDERR